MAATTYYPRFIEARLAEALADTPVVLIHGHRQCARPHWPRDTEKLQRATGTRFTAGVVLYDGETRVPFGDHLFAVPIRTLWEP